MARFALICAFVLWVACGGVNGKLEKKCARDEQYYDCVPSCKNTCKNYFNPGVRCACAPPGCYCKDGLVKNDDGKCVKPETCPNKKCYSPNEEYSSCVIPCNNCEIKGKCNFLVCNEGCDCKKGYYRDELGICIPERECPVKAKETTTEYPDEYTTYNDFFTDEPYSEATADGSYSKATEGPVSEKVKFRCRLDGLFAYPPDCTRFIQCSNGRAFVMNCPEGLHFSERNRRCDYPCEAQCSPTISEKCRKERTNEVCSLPRNKGECHKYMVRYYFDVAENKCKKFVFGGCNGNGNNFKSEKQCLEVCGRGVAEDTTTQDSRDSYPTKDTWEYDNLFNFQGSTDASYWTSEKDASLVERNSRRYPTESADEYLSYSTDNYPQEPSEDSWDSSTNSDSRTTEDSSWDVDSDQSGGPQSPSLPGFSTEKVYSFKARVVDDFQCRGNGAYSNPDDCASFIWCPLDRAIVVPCPPNTHYSEHRDECVDPCLAHCNTSLACQCGWPECHQYNHFDCESDPDAGPCPDRELRYFYDRERGRCKSFYYGGCHGNGNNFRTLKECQRECQTSLLAGFRCPSYNGNFGHYPDCVSYYQCKRGIPTLKRCPTGTAFHHLKAKCVPEEEAMCVYECQEPNAVYPAPKDCRSYIDCVNGIPKLEKCPRGLAFDIGKRNCVLERTTSCTW